MADEPDNLVLQTLRAVREREDEHSSRFDEIEAIVNEIRLPATSHDLRFDGPEERVDTIRKGAVTAVGCSLRARRGPVELREPFADPRSRVEKPEAGR